MAVLAVAALSACASLPSHNQSGANPSSLRLLDRDEDFVNLGIDRHIVISREDGRRSPHDSRYFEWWYFDGLLDDGTVVVAWLGDNWPFGIEKRTASLEVTPKGGRTRRWFGSFVESGAFGTDGADVRVGPNSFVGNLDDYRIVIDPNSTGGLGDDFRLHARVAPWRPSSGVVADGESFFAWLVPVPEGEVSGILTIDGKTLEVRGSGYHDHNWGNISPALLMDSWWWGRATVGDRTVIASQLRGAKEKGGGAAPLLFVGSPRGLEKEAWSTDEVTVREGRQVAHPDPAHTRTIGSFVSYSTMDGYSVTFPISDRMITSADFLDGQAWSVVAFARMAGLKPWYSRFASPVTLSVPGDPPASGEGTLEFFEFR